MNGLRNVAEQSADRIRRQPRARLRLRVSGGVRRRAVLIEPPGNLAELEFGNGAFEFVELLVQETDFLSIAETEGRDVGARTMDFRGAFGQRRFDIRKAARQIAVFSRWSGSDEVAHVPMISNYLMRPAVRKRR